MAYTTTSHRNWIAGDARPNSVPRSELIEGPKTTAASIPTLRRGIAADDCDDGMIESIAIAATAAIEQELSACLITQKWRLWFDDCHVHAGTEDLIKAPVQSVDLPNEMAFPQAANSWVT